MLDRLLVETWLRSRDESTFRILYHRHAAVLWRLALRLNAGDRAGAEEIVQDAWLRAVQRLPGFRWESSLRTWLCGIVVFRWREQVRRERVENQRVVPMPPGFETENPSPDTALRLDLESAFSALPEPLRETLALHDLEGFRHREIAGMLGIAEGTSKSRVSEARAALRAFLKK